MGKDLVTGGSFGMTVKQIAEALGVAESTVRNKVKELFPDKTINGLPTILGEDEVVAIKRSIVPRNLTLKSKLDLANTDLEMYEKMAAVQTWLVSKIEQLKSERDDAVRRNTILMHVSKTYTATEIAKEVGLRSAQELNESLEQGGIQYKVNGTWVPTAEYSGLGYFDIKQEVLDNGTVVYHRKITQPGRDFIVREIFGIE